MTRHTLAETAASYGSDATTARHVKLSISLPAELVDELRIAAKETGLGVSAVVAAALRHSVASAEQERLDRALALDAPENEQWANDLLAVTAREWAELTW